MKINTNSWHYKLVTLGGKERAPYTLCPYFWKGVWNLSIILFGIFIAGLISWAMGESLSLLIFTKLGLTLSPIIAVISSIILGLLLIVFVMSSLIAIAYGFYKLISLFQEKRKKKWVNDLEAGKNPESNVIIAYIKARKRKVCPILEFTDAEK